MIIHGTKDDVVPFWHGDELLRSFPNKCRAQPYWVEGLGHNHIEVKRKDEYIRRINSFIDKYVIPHLSRQSNDVVGVPRNEQYMPETSLKASGKFVVNQTWMKHGMAIVHEAMNEKKTKMSNDHKTDIPKEAKVSKVHVQQQQQQQQQQHPRYLTAANQGFASRFPNQHPSFDNCNQKINSINLSRMNTNELVKKTTEYKFIKSARQLKDSESCQTSLSGSVKSVETASSRYLLTKESWGTDDEEDVSFDDDKENKEKGGDKSVSLQTFSAGNQSRFSLESSNIQDMCELNLKKEEDEETNSDYMVESFDRYSVQSIASSKNT